MVDYGSTETVPARLHPLQDREGVDTCIKRKKTSSELSWSTKMLKELGGLHALLMSKPLYLAGKEDCNHNETNC